MSVKPYRWWLQRAPSPQHDSLVQLHVTERAPRGRARGYCWFIYRHVTRAQLRAFLPEAWATLQRQMAGRMDHVRYDPVEDVPPCAAP